MSRWPVYVHDQSKFPGDWWRTRSTCDWDMWCEMHSFTNFYRLNHRLILVADAIENHIGMVSARSRGINLMVVRFSREPTPHYSVQLRINGDYFERGFNNNLLTREL